MCHNHLYILLMFNKIGKHLFPLPVYNYHNYFYEYILYIKKSSWIYFIVDFDKIIPALCLCMPT